MPEGRPFVAVFVAAFFALSSHSAGAQSPPPVPTPPTAPEKPAASDAAKPETPATAVSTVPEFCLTTGGKPSARIPTNLRELSNGKSSYGGAIIFDAYLLPTGSVDIGIDHPFTPNLRYYAFLVSGDGDSSITLKNVRAWESTNEDSLVKKQKLEPKRTIVNLRIPDLYQPAFAWRRVDLFVFTCMAPPDNNPELVSRADVRISPGTYSAIAAWASVAILYLLAAFAFGEYSSVSSFLNPIRMTAGMDGKASLGKLQILFFSMIVFGLIQYLLFRTGLLTDISSTVLTLLGIAGVGSTAAKGADLQRTTISPENKAYLMRKNWLSATTTANPNVATWSELFTTDGEFDVYRYQSFIFSLAVGGALLIAGVFQLSSFEIPTTLLGILGLSQVVYIGGKLVTPTTMAELNKIIGDMRDAEQQFRDAAIAANAGTAPQTLLQAVQPASQAAYDAYMKLATDARTLFKAQTGIDVDVTKLAPTL
jgi:hypothetical protein